MRFSEILNLVRLNLIQNKFKVLLTSIGIIVGAATIVLVIAVGKGGKAEVAEQFRNLNAGAIDISYEQAQSASGLSFSPGSAPSPGGSGERPDMSSFAGFGGNMPSFSGGSGNRPDSSSGGKPDTASGSRGGGFFSGFGSIFGGMFGGGDTKNTERITLSTDDMDEITASVPGLSEATISYTTKQDIYGGNIEETESYTVAGTLSDYASLSNLTLMFGDYLSDADNENKIRSASSDTLPQSRFSALRPMPTTASFILTTARIRSAACWPSRGLSNPASARTRHFSSRMRPASSI